MNFFETVNALNSKDAAVALFNSMADDLSPVIDYTARHPAEANFAFIKLKGKLGHGYQGKVNEIIKVVKGQAEALAAALIVEVPAKSVLDSMESLPPERVLAKDVARNLEVPPGFVLSERGVAKLVRTKNGMEEVHIIDECIILSGTYRSVESNDRYVTLVFRDLDFDWMTVPITLEDVGNLNKILSLARHGIMVNNDNRQHLMEYLTAFYSRNKYKLPNKVVTSKLGWTDEEPPRFVTPLETLSIADYVKCVEFKAKDGFSQKAQAIRTKGTLASDMVTMEVIKKYPIAMLAIGHGLASFMIKSVLRNRKVPGSILDVGGRRGTGKSTLSGVYSWLIGKPGFGPREAGNTWNMTMRRMQETAGTYGSYPMLLDETKHQETKYFLKGAAKNLANAVYFCHDGVAQGNLNKNSSGQVQASCNNNWMSTGETTIRSMVTGHAGVGARILTIEDPPFGAKSDEAQRDIKYIDQRIQQSYGNIGRAFIDLCLQMMAAEDSSAEMLYDTNYDWVCSMTNDTDGTRVGWYLAAALTALELAHKHLGMPRPEKDLEPIVRKCMRIVNHSADKSDYALRRIVETMQANPQHVINLGASGNSTIWGAWPGKRTPFVFVTNEQLNKFFVEFGVGPRTVMEEWARKGYVMFSTDADRKEDEAYEEWIIKARQKQRFKLPGGRTQTLTGVKIDLRFLQDIVNYTEPSDDDPAPVEKQPILMEPPKW